MKTFLTMVTVIATVTILSAQRAEKATIYFNYDKHELTADSKTELEKIFKADGNKEVQKLIVTGYTDSDGSEQYNDILSKNRALSVMDFLTANGFAKNNIKVEYYGERQPAASNESAGGKQQNRRVEIILEYAGFSIPKEFTPQTKSFVINPNSDTSITLNSKGTVLHIPKNCFADMHGKTAKENVTIQFTEYNNPADMAFSNIPMTYKTEGEEFFFNSSGMFDIQGSVNNNPVQVAENKSMKIDFALAKQNPDIDFFQLQEDGNWEKVQEIEPVKTMSRQAVLSNEYDVDSVIFDSELIFISRRTESNYSNSTEYGYPDIIDGLNLNAFGYYNCDQIYRVRDLVAIEATYVDTAGKLIHNLHTLSLIDLRYNGALSYFPTRFTCSAKGENVLALFTKDNKLYILDKSEFAKMKIKRGGSYTFTMKDMTETIKSSKDLAGYLGIKM